MKRKDEAKEEEEAEELKQTMTAIVKMRGKEMKFKIVIDRTAHTHIESKCECMVESITP